MQTALIINGAEAHPPTASTRLNALLSETLQQELHTSYKILTTVVAEGYDIPSEQRKFQEADLIIFQFPIFWFATPPSLKKYIDEVYTYGVFFAPAEHYGRGGLLTGKSYMLSTTWNAKAGDFSDPLSIVSKHTPDSVLAPFHFTQQYVGLNQVASFSEQDVIRNPDATGAVRRLREHLQRHVLGK